MHLPLLICIYTTRRGKPIPKSFLDCFFFPLFGSTEPTILLTWAVTNTFCKGFFKNCRRNGPFSNLIWSLAFNTQGALCAAPLIFIVPSACYLKLSEEPRTHSDKMMSCVMLPIGAIVMAAGFVMAVTDPQDCTHGQEMFYCFPGNASVTNSSVSHFQLTTQLSILNISNFE